MGCGGTGGSLPGLLPLDANHPDAHEIFCTGNLDEDYEVEKDPIARGKFASVRLARHRTTKEVFAAKFIRRRRRAANIEEEARHEIAVLLLGRSAPHIVHIHQVYQTRTDYIIILEFGAGGDLQRLLDDQSRLPEKTVKELLQQILKGLSFLHGQHIAHLDIKPQNLVLMGPSPDDELKLVDFGLSRVIHQDTELTQIMGTPDYVAPEIINFEAVGLGTDMWSIGVLTYVFLTGYTPFGGETDQETFVNITQGDFDFPDEYFTGVSEQAKDFIACLLIKSPRRRMTVEQCFAHPWMCGLFDPHRLSQLSEADSGYSTDHCTGSPPSPDSITNEFVPEIYQSSIPGEETILSSTPRSYLSPTFRKYPVEEITDTPLENSREERRHRLSSAHLSIDVRDCLQQPKSKPLRRSSLVIPRYVNEECNNDFNANQTYNALFPVEDEESWNNNCSSIDKPWTNLCNGSYTRALNQLHTKSSPKKKKVPKSNLGLRPELSCSMFELQPKVENLNSYYPNLRSSKCEMRKTKIHPSCWKSDLQEVLRGSCRELGTKKKSNFGETGNSSGSLHLGFPIVGNRCKLISHRNESRGSKSNIRSPEKETKSSLINLYKQSTSTRLNMSLSRLDLTDQIVDESEERDVVYSDCTLPRRFNRSSNSPMFRGNSFHMSFRRPKKRDQL